MQLNTNTAVQEVEHPIATKHHIRLWMKRDDLIHPFISGNKWRKLQFVIEDAISVKAKRLVSFGGAYSNHLVALACAGAIFKFKTKAFVRGEQVSNPMLQLCKTWGMELEFVSRTAYLNKQLLFTQSKLPGDYFIDEGGKGLLAVKGCVNIIPTTQTFTHAVCAVGTGTTFAGVVKQANELGIEPMGIVVLKGAEEIKQDIVALLNEPNKFKLFHQFHEGGYAKTTNALWQFIDDFAAHTGILLDQVYTGKMMKAVFSLIESGYFKQGSSILTIHTGGLLGTLTRPL